MRAEMSLYKLHDSPLIAAWWLPDEMLESTIISAILMLSSTHRFFDGIPRRLLVANRSAQYPWCLPDEGPFSLLPLGIFSGFEWTRDTEDNYFWMFFYTKNIFDEILYRKGINHPYKKYLERLDRLPEKYEPSNLGPLWDPLIDQLGLLDVKNLNWTFRQVPWWYEKR